MRDRTLSPNSSYSEPSLADTESYLFREGTILKVVSSQGAFSLAMRDMERDIIPMCRNNGMSIGEFTL